MTKSASVPFLSVMIPVYNKCEYIDKCLDSLVSQTFKDFEIIIVDDGSTDNSFEVCAKWAKADPRIKLYKKSNGGVASARSYALHQATGEYIINCDPDDWLELNAFECLYSEFQHSEADMVIFDFIRDYQSGRQAISTVKFDCSTPRSSFISMLSTRSFSTCNKMIRRSIVVDNKIDYVPGINVGEDFLFLAKVFLTLPQTCVKIDKALYHYRETPGGNSLTQKVTLKSLYGHEEILKWRFENLKGAEFDRLNLRSAIGFLYLVVRCDECPISYANSVINTYIPLKLLMKSKPSLKWMIALSCKIWGYRFVKRTFNLIFKKNE